MTNMLTRITGSEIIDLPPNRMSESFTYIHPVLVYPGLKCPPDTLVPTYGILVSVSWFEQQAITNLASPPLDLGPCQLLGTSDLNQVIKECLV
jgi:hypothetical protein